MKLTLAFVKNQFLANGVKLPDGYLDAKEYQRALQRSTVTLTSDMSEEDMQVFFRWMLVDNPLDLQDKRLYGGAQILARCLYDFKVNDAAEPEADWCEILADKGRKD